MQAVDAEAAEYTPAAHFWHVALQLKACVPAGQVHHPSVFVFSVDENVPATHSRQKSLTISKIWPGIMVWLADDTRGALMKVCLGPFHCRPLRSKNEKEYCVPASISAARDAFNVPLDRSQSAAEAKVAEGSEMLKALLLSVKDPVRPSSRKYVTQLARKVKLGARRTVTVLREQGAFELSCMLELSTFQLTFLMYIGYKSPGCAL